MKISTCIYIILTLTCWFTILEAQPVAEFHFDGNLGDASYQEPISNTTFDITNHFNRPEYIDGVAGTALRLDGWSTWALNNSYQIPDVSTQMTIETWYATEAFTAETAGIVSQKSSTSGFVLGVDSYGHIVFSFVASGTEYTLETDNKIEKYSWNHIVAYADLESNTAKIYVNSDEWASASLSSHSSFDFSGLPFYLGRHSNTQEFSGFLLTAANGALDEVNIYNTILSEATIENNYNEYAGTIPDLTIDPDLRYEGDYLRPQYHPMPNAVWCNEAYGLTYYDGKYHLFFQKNPNGPYLYFMHWGHLSSPDLVNWTEEKIPLAPSELPGFDSFGTWSGTTFFNDLEEPVIAYTGVDGVKAGIGIANKQDDDLIEWEKSESNPVVAMAPTSYNHLDFRDPYVWEKDGIYYMIVGSGLQNNGGGILFTYKSNDLANWILTDPLFQNSNLGQSGIFWEMPAFIPFNEEDYMLLVNPVPQPNIPAASLYWMGSWQDEEFSPYQNEPKPFELINNNLLAPAIGVDEENRPTYIGIIPEDRAVEDQVAAGWRQVFSIPRAMRLLDDGKTTGHIPHPNLCRLREEAVLLEGRTIQPNTNFNLPEFESNQAELKMAIVPGESPNFRIQVYKHEDAQEFTSVIFDLEEGRIGLDRRFSTFSPATKDLRYADYDFNPNDTVSINLFLDHSILEVFVDQLVVFSCRVYPSRIESQKIDLITADEPIQLVKMEAWRLKSIGDELEDLTCEPVNLPGGLFTNTRELPLKKNEWKVFPNPVRNQLTIQWNGEGLPGNSYYHIYSSNGQLFKQSQFLGSERKVSTDNLPTGLIWVELNDGRARQIEKVVIIK